MSADLSNLIRNAKKHNNKDMLVPDWKKRFSINQLINYIARNESYGTTTITASALFYIVMPFIACPSDAT